MMAKDATSFYQNNNYNNTNYNDSNRVNEYNDKKK